MTNIRVIGEENVVLKVLKPIELVLYLVTIHVTTKIIAKAKDFKNVELISRGYLNGMDLIFCYDEDRNNRNGTYLCLGYWNDGVIQYE